MAERVETGHHLSQEERERFDADGYIVRNAVFDAAEIEQIAAACEELVDRLVRDRRGQRQTVGSYVFDLDRENEVMIKWEGDTDVVHGIEPFAHLSPTLERWAYDPRFIDPMKDVLGVPDPELFTEKLNLKRPHLGGANPLHQDYPYWRRVADEPAEVFTAMLFLDDSSIENGCLFVVPGSHRNGMWRGRTDGDAFAANEVDTAAYPDVQPVPVEVPAGSVVWFGAYLVHQSAQNTSETERRALLYSYQPPGRRHQLDSLRKQTRR